MSTLNDQWTVQPHGPIEHIDEGLLSVAGEITMPLGNFPRRMTVIGLSGGRTAIWSAIPLREPEMQKIEELGTPAFLIVPGIAHRLDLKPWKQRYPQAKVVCPFGAADAVREAVPVDATDEIFHDPSVRFEAVPGTGGKEAVLHVFRTGRVSLLLNDILANVAHPHGLGAKVMAWVMGFGVDEPRMPWVGKRMFVEDKAALAAAFRDWGEQPDLKHIVVSHGDVIRDDPRGVLTRIAGQLSG